MMVTIRSNINIIVIQLYVVTINSTDNEIDELYCELKRALSNTKNQELNVIMVDFRDEIVTPVGKVWKVGLWKRNERGSRLVELCRE